MSMSDDEYLNDPVRLEMEAEITKLRNKLERVHSFCTAMGADMEHASGKDVILGVINIIDNAYEETTT
jgi:hypothetical protein